MLGLQKKPEIFILVDKDNNVRGVKGIIPVDPAYKGLIKTVKVCKKERHLFKVGDKSVIWQHGKNSCAYSEKHAKAKAIRRLKILDFMFLLNPEASRALFIKQLYGYNLNNDFLNSKCIKSACYSIIKTN